MPKRSSKKPALSHLNQLAAEIVKEAITDAADSVSELSSGKNPHAAALGRLGGKKGGSARAKKLTPERRKEIAKKAAETRWAKK